MNYVIDSLTLYAIILKYNRYYSYSISIIDIIVISSFILNNFISIFSEPLTKMFAKSWSGVIQLLDYMIKSYHRYVKHTSNLQKESSDLVRYTLLIAS